MTYYIYSTLSTDMRYTEYQDSIQGQKVSIVKHAVKISGRANVADKNFITPRGVMTKVTDEDFAMLSKNALFELHRQNGYITFDKKQADIDKVIVNMKKRDESAPITPEFYDKAPEEIAKPDAKTEKTESIKVAVTDPILTFDVALFRSQFPAFADSVAFPDALLQMYWDMATCYISDINCGWLNNGCRQLAINMMVAHLAAINVLIGEGITPQLIKSSTVDKITVSLEMPPVPNQWRWWLNTTPYGMQLLALLAANSAGGFYVGGSPELSGFRTIYGSFGGGFSGANCAGGGCC